MGKRIAQQARGRAGPAYRIRKKAYKDRINYPPLNEEGKATIKKIFNSSAHSAPLAEIQFNKKSFLIPAADSIYEGKEINIIHERDDKKIEFGDISKLKDIPQGTRVFNLESTPGKGGKILRTAGSSGIIGTKDKRVEIIIKRRKIKLNPDCRATIGIIAGEGRKTKPMIKAGKKHHLMKSKGRKWHRTSAVKVNAIDHPFGGGRGKRIKSKIAKRNASPGKKVGHLRPRKTGKRK